MILLLDTSSPIARMTLIDGSDRIYQEWQADRTLAKDLLKRLNEFLDSNRRSWSDIDGLGVLSGPGSFTGLRIGITVMNTIANCEHIPIVSGEGEDWHEQVPRKLASHEDEKIIIPNYGAQANITAPKK